MLTHKRNKKTMNRTVNKKNRMKMMNKIKIRKIRMINNKEVVTMIKIKMSRVIKISNSKVQGMTTNNSQSSNKRRKIKSCQLSKWLIANNLNSLSSPLYWAKYRTFLVRWIILSEPCIRLHSQECLEEPIRIIMPRRISSIKLDCRISKCPNLLSNPE